MTAAPDTRRWLNRAATFTALVSGLALGAALFNENLWSKVYTHEPLALYSIRLMTTTVELGGPLEVEIEVDKNRDCPVEILELVRPAGEELAPWTQVGHYRAPLFPVGDNAPKIFAVQLPPRLFPPGKYVYDRFSHYLCGTGHNGGIYTYGSGPLEFEIVSPEPRAVP